MNYFILFYCVVAAVFVLFGHIFSCSRIWYFSITRRYYTYTLLTKSNKHVSVHGTKVLFYEVTNTTEQN